MRIKQITWREIIEIEEKRAQDQGPQRLGSKKRSKSQQKRLRRNHLRGREENHNKTVLEKEGVVHGSF